MRTVRTMRTIGTMRKMRKIITVRTIRTMRTMTLRMNDPIPEITFLAIENDNLIIHSDP